MHAAREVSAHGTDHRLHKKRLSSVTEYGKPTAAAACKLNCELA